MEGGGGNATPMSFSELDATPFWSIVLKFSIADGASFAQLMVKKMVRSGHEVMTS